MTRVIPAPLLAHFTGTSANAGECLIIEAKDGTRACFTTRDEPVTVDLGLGEGDEVCDGGINLSSLTLAIGLEASFAEFAGPLGPVLTRAAVEGGKWDDAAAWLVRISPGIAGFAPMLAGKVREVRSEGAQFFLEFRNQADGFNQPIGRLISPYCNADLGDARCGFANPVIDATVTVVTDAMRFTVSFAGSYADDFFNVGTVIFTSGGLDGIAPIEIFDWTAAGVIVLFEPLIAAPEVGDTLELRRGCPKTRAACRDIFANILNFRGEPEVPGSDQVLKAQVPQ